METQTRQQTLQELYDSLPERAERVSPWERFNPSTGVGEEAKRLYERSKENRKHFRKRLNGIQDLIDQEYGFSFEGHFDELTAIDYEHSFRPVHALKYRIKYSMNLAETIKYSKEAKLGKRELKAAIRSLLSEAQKIHDYVEENNQKLGGEGKITTTNSFLRNTSLMRYHLRENYSHPDAIYKAVYLMQFEQHKLLIKAAQHLTKELEELDRSKK